jgi:hypothetical protein
MKEAAARNLRGGRDVVERGRLETALQEQRHRRPGQTLTGLLPLALAQAGRGVEGARFRL